MAVKDEPKRGRRAIPKKVKETVWKKHFGPKAAEGTCNVCGQTIRITEFDAGHIIARAKGGTDAIENLLPLCRGCNGAMGTRNLKTYKAEYYGKGKTKGARAQAPAVSILGIVRSYVSRQGYEPQSKKYGFDVCGKKQEGLLSSDKYLVVDIMEPVTERGITAFKKKLSKLHKMFADKDFFTPTIEGVIAHKGTLPEGSKALVKGFKPGIGFKKF